MKNRYALYAIVDGKEIFIPTSDSDRYCSESEATDFCEDMAKVEYFMVGTENGYIGVGPAMMSKTFFSARKQ
jgi:hypothetical protein